ncbi:hypothetical protein GCM10028793_42160 [Nocardiopsis oceani]
MSVCLDLDALSAQTDTMRRDRPLSTPASDDPETGLRAVLALRRTAERVEANQVAVARQAGWSWQQIGDALGVTRQSIHAKHGK